MQDENTIKLDLTGKQSLDKRIEKTLSDIWDALKALSINNHESKKTGGYLLIVGTFSKHDYNIPNLRQMGESNIHSFMSVGSDKFSEFLDTSREEDGAIIIDQHGQVLASKVYIIPENPNVDIDSEGNTRHIAAASASSREDVLAAFILSEESNKVKRFDNGKVVNTFDYAEELEEEFLRKKQLEEELEEEKSKESEDEVLVPKKKTKKRELNKWKKSGL